MPADIKYMVQECAKIGTLVYYMNQSNTDPLSEPGPWGTIDGGYCAGLTVRWIRLTYACRASATRTRTPAPTSSPAPRRR